MAAYVHEVEMRLTIVCLLLVVPLSAQSRSPAVDSTLHGGILTLVQEFGKARYTTCRLRVFYNQPPMPRTDRVELSCTPLPDPRVDDVVTSRDLSTEEAALVAQLAVASDLYSGGHVGAYGQTGSEGPWERLEIGRCCESRNSVVLITDGNPTFSTGSRRDLLTLLAKWRAELVPKLPGRKAR
jgi:hypothetical protein